MKDKLQQDKSGSRETHQEGLALGTDCSDLNQGSVLGDREKKGGLRTMWHLNSSLNGMQGIKENAQIFVLSNLIVGNTLY